jgi:hypothetical protein
MIRKCYKLLKMFKDILHLLNYFETYVNVRLMYQKSAHTNITQFQHYFNL